MNIVETCTHCTRLKYKWDEKLKDSGFEDAEQDKLLKKWTGISMDQSIVSIAHVNIIDKIKIQEPLSSIKSNWPEPNFTIEEGLLNNPDLEEICESLCKHGNHIATAQQMIEIWKQHCEGSSTRVIGKKVKLHNVTVYRVIRRLREVSKL